MNKNATLQKSEIENVRTIQEKEIKKRIDACIRHVDDCRRLVPPESKKELTNLLERIFDLHEYIGSYAIFYNRLATAITLFEKLFSEKGEQKIQPKAAEAYVELKALEQYVKSKVVF